LLLIFSVALKAQSYPIYFMHHVQIDTTTSTDITVYDCNTTYDCNTQYSCSLISENKQDEKDLLAYKPDDNIE
jgi:hypothetical protein